MQKDALVSSESRLIGAQDFFKRLVSDH